MKPTKQQAQAFLNEAYAFAENLQERVTWDLEISSLAYNISYHAKCEETGWSYNKYISRFYSIMSADGEHLTDSDNQKALSAIFAEAYEALQKANLLK